MKAIFMPGNGGPQESFFERWLEYLGTLKVIDLIFNHFSDKITSLYEDYAFLIKVFTNLFNLILKNY
jgi:hypothetical protein